MNFREVNKEHYHPDYPEAIVTWRKLHKTASQKIHNRDCICRWCCILREKLDHGIPEEQHDGCVKYLKAEKPELLKEIHQYMKDFWNERYRNRT